MSQRNSTRELTSDAYAWLCGSFKVMGALNWMSNHQEAKVVAAHSSGNFASGLAYAGNAFGKEVEPSLQQLSLWIGHDQDNSACNVSTIKNKPGGRGDAWDRPCMQTSLDCELWRRNTSLRYLHRPYHWRSRRARASNHYGRLRNALPITVTWHGGVCWIWPSSVRIRMNRQDESYTVASWTYLWIRMCWRYVHCCTFVFVS